MLKALILLQAFPWAAALLLRGNVSSNATKLGAQAVAFHARIPSDTDCSTLPLRTFQFLDPVCGQQEFRINDVLHAYQVDQAYWEEQGRENPWWGVLTGSKKGIAIPEEDKLEFYRSGEKTVHAMEDMLKPYQFLEPAWRTGKTALDFGCGLGRMSNALTKLGFASVICVDMTQSYLQAAGAALQSLAGRGNVAPDALSKISFRHSDPWLLCHVQPQSVDFVHSVITLQHNKPALQMIYLEQLCDALKPGGRGFVGIPTMIFQQDKSLHCDIGNEPVQMNMHYTPQAEVIRHLSTRGCQVVTTLPVQDIGDAGQSSAFLFYKL